jgi:hypothetical protein
MIKPAKFNPPPSFPPRSLSSSEREMYNLGIKITCALELLTSSNSQWSKDLIDIWNVERLKLVNDERINAWEENQEQVDDEQWMTLSADDVRKIMAENKSEDDQVKDMIEQLSKFMEGESGFEGIDDYEGESDDDFDDEEELD